MALGASGGRGDGIPRGREGERRFLLAKMEVCARSWPEAIFGFCLVTLCEDGQSRVN